jgi:rubrerythrin
MEEGTNLENAIAIAFKSEQQTIEHYEKLIAIIQNNVIGGTGQ